MKKPPISLKKWEAAFSGKREAFPRKSSRSAYAINAMPKHSFRAPAL